MADEYNLWHYTTLAGLKGIVESGCLWATHYRYLNDPTELNHSRNILHQSLYPTVINVITETCRNNAEARAIADREGGVEKLAEMETAETIGILFDALFIQGRIRAFPCILSFCAVLLEDSEQQASGLLSQWRGYGKDGGIAIVFNLDKISEEWRREKDCFYYGFSGDGRSVYVSSPKDVVDPEYGKSLTLVTEYAKTVYEVRLGRASKKEVDDSIFGAFLHCLFLSKHKGFSEEKEYRFYGSPYFEEVLGFPGFVKRDSAEFKKIKFRLGIEGMIPYVKFFEKSSRLPIERICIGPHKDSGKRLESIRKFLDLSGYDDVKISVSEIPFVGSR